MNKKKKLISFSINNAVYLGTGEFHFNQENGLEKIEVSTVFAHKNVKYFACCFFGSFSRHFYIIIKAHICRFEDNPYPTNEKSRFRPVVTLFFSNIKDIYL